MVVIDMGAMSLLALIYFAGIWYYSIVAGTTLLAYLVICGFLLAGIVLAIKRLGGILERRHRQLDGDRDLDAADRRAG